MIWDTDVSPVSLLGTNERRNNGASIKCDVIGQTVMLAPATGFYGTPGLGVQEVRLAYVLNVTAINAAMDCLEQALRVYPGKTL